MEKYIEFTKSYRFYEDNPPMDITKWDEEKTFKKRQHAIDWWMKQDKYEVMNRIYIKGEHRMIEPFYKTPTMLSLYLIVNNDQYESIKKDKFDRIILEEETTFRFALTYDYAKEISLPEKETVLKAKFPDKYLKIFGITVNDFIYGKDLLVPADKLDQFNSNLFGKLQVV